MFNSTPSPAVESAYTNRYEEGNTNQSSGMAKEQTPTTDAARATRREGRPPLQARSSNIQVTSIATVARKRKRAQEGARDATPLYASKAIANPLGDDTIDVPGGGSLFIPEDGDSDDEDAHAPEPAYTQDSNDEDVDSPREVLPKKLRGRQKRTAT
jgi:hypothetical protein